jgi:hypothetical protein
LLLLMAAVLSMSHSSGDKKFLRQMSMLSISLLRHTTWCTLGLLTAT